MSYNKFVLYNKFFHLNDNKFNPDNKLDKIRNFYNYVKSKWNQYYSAGTHLTIDEGVAPFDGVSKYKQYMPAKPTKWGLKIYMLSDSMSDYILSAPLYTGNSESTENYTIKLVMGILKDHYWKGHRLFIDNFYCCPFLIKHLYFKDTFVTGTTRNNRKGLPKEFIEKLKLEDGEMRTYKNQRKKNNLAL